MKPLSEPELVDLLQKITRAREAQQGKNPSAEQLLDFASELLKRRLAKH